MATISMQKGNSAKGFADLTADQKERVLIMFTQLRPPTDYLYEIDQDGDIRCRRYIAARNVAGELVA